MEKGRLQSELERQNEVRQRHQDALRSAKVSSELRRAELSELRIVLNVSCSNLVGRYPFSISVN